MRRALLILFPLYLAQGLPYGFQVTALPLLLRARGVSLAAIGFVGLLALPWMAKALWAPLVDRFGSRRIGHYKSWILPLQAAMSALALALSPVAAHSIPALLAGLFALNLLAATQDIAVDGLAVRTLREDELGPANAIQVVGYKAGMLIGGGLLLLLSDRYGWHGVFAGMSLVMALVCVMSWLMIDEQHGLARDLGPRQRMGDIARALWQAARQQGGPFLVVIATYKIGETMVDAMFKPFLHDAGFSAADIGLWLGTYGMVASLLGSAAGGAFARRAGIERTVVLSAALRVAPLLGVWWLTLAAPSAQAVITINVLEHFFGGMLTTAMFALMMKRTERSIGATHYTLLASIEVAGKSPGNWASGFIAERSGYGALFLLGSALSAIYVGLAAWLLRRRK